MLDDAIILDLAADLEHLYTVDSFSIDNEKLAAEILLVVNNTK